MLDKIIKFSVNNKLLVGIFIALWIAIGSYQLTRLPIDAVPDITNNQVQIITTAPALGAEDVERLITFPIEQAISNIPGLTESRSFSRFGLSIVSIVFDDDMDVYLARQLVTERLSQAEIDQNAGKPTLAPVTTGLGEIYQYVIRPKKGFEKKYSLSDLRTVQDWIVRRQLLGTPGVADVSTMGGELKQYEVAIIPAQLKAMNLTISDVFTALNKNNQNTGGAYIEKGPSVMYIRSMGLAGSMEDIGNIVVKNTTDGIPVLIQNIAEVRLGSSIRYGALTMNGFGEVSGGIVMMLKGANSSEVIKNVKARIEQIQKTLPEGLEIEAFLDRTKMVNNAIGTVEKNLLEGALIVVFVLVLFLGNLRAGLIVASVIPLSMLFAVSMMNLFGVSGNLMSLGALDFGLIVDGAVIIVEAILHHLHFSKQYDHVNQLSQKEMDREVSTSASRMMNAAVFGQVIILIVYLPILSLSGIEGKMFKPMAQTVAFAVTGAFILSLTYVPMISSLVISKKITHKITLAERVFGIIENQYSKLLEKALKIKTSLVIASFGLFTISLFLFVQMGGEFIPQLEEGDFATETRLLIGTNLTTTIESFSKISDELKSTYPEVEKIVSRIGSAEIPSDPMPIEGGDMVIVLKDKSEWTSAKSFSELASKMAATAQEVAPGVTTGFQFPVQMRFNELMTGAKQDVVCKIYGEDLNKLAAYAEQLGAISRTVQGATDLYIEEVIGMPQVVIKFNHLEIARYGLNIADVNQTINAAFAGAVAGQIYEGEKKFDLVVRVGERGRRNINDIQNLLISTPNGLQLPLNQVANIEEIEGPNQIQRENTKRRIIVGFNIRGRDIQNIVEELQKKVEKDLRLEAGYSIEYGGAFENLQQAKNRLMVAVPIALLLIFVLLYFAFSSIKDAALIYTAIPLSAIGGVFALVLRDMPFSISAGVGFIALFGVAVLNGIVLLSEINRLKKEGNIDNTLSLLITATKNRLRPVLMTASVASLGFLPMALSNGAGAEVQRPLATVVIGGLVTATLLTLFVLPAIYLLFDRKISKVTSKASFLLLLLIYSNSTFAQSTISLEHALEISIKKNRSIQSSIINEQAAKALRSSAYDLAKTNISFDYGKVNSAHNDNRVGISQTFSFPTVYNRQKLLLNESHLISMTETRLTEQEIKGTLRQLFFEYRVLEEREKLLHYADSIYRLFEEKAVLRFTKGEANILEKTTAETKRSQISNQLEMVKQDQQILIRQFNMVIQDGTSYRPESGPAQIVSQAASNIYNINQLPQIELNQHFLNASKFRWHVEKSKNLPEIMLGYNNQSLIGVQNVNGQDVYYGGGKRFSYASAGLLIPLFYKAQNARIQSAKLEYDKERIHLEQVQFQLAQEILTATDQVEKHAKSLKFHEQSALKNAEIILNTANQQFANGEIDFLQWTLLADQTIALRNEYINAIQNYNLSVIQLLKLQNQ